MRYTKNFECYISGSVFVCLLFFFLCDRCTISLLSTSSLKLQAKHLFCFFSCNLYFVGLKRHLITMLTPPHHWPQSVLISQVVQQDRCWVALYWCNPQWLWQWYSWWYSWWETALMSCPPPGLHCDTTEDTKTLTVLLLPACICTCLYSVSMGNQPELSTPWDVGWGKKTRLCWYFNWPVSIACIHAGASSWICPPPPPYFLPQPVGVDVVLALTPPPLLWGVSLGVHRWVAL